MYHDLNLQNADALPFLILVTGCAYPRVIIAGDSSWTPFVDQHPEAETLSVWQVPVKHLLLDLTMPWLQDFPNGVAN